MGYKWCVVPQCTNTTISSPHKLFLFVPTNPKRRKMWLQLAQRDPNSIAMHTNVFMCEDHFDMEKDTKNYMKYKMGFSQRILLEDKAVPTKFHCQEDRKRRLSNAASSREVFLKRQRTELVAECQKSQSATETHAESLQKDDTIQKVIEPEESDMSLDIKEEIEDFVFVDVDETSVQDQLFEQEDDRESPEIIEDDPLALNHDQYEIIEPSCVFQPVKFQKGVSEVVKCDPEVCNVFSSPKFDNPEEHNTSWANILQSASNNKAIKNEIVILDDDWEEKEEDPNVSLCVCFSCKNKFRCISSLEKHCECKGSREYAIVSKLSCPCGAFCNNSQAHVVPSERMFQCKHCDSLFSKATELIAHSKSHERKHNSCTNSKKIFCNFDKLQNHLNSCEGENLKENRRRPTRAKHGSGTCSTCQIVSPSVKARRRSKCAKKSVQRCTSKNTSRKKTLKKTEVLKDKPSKDVFQMCSSCKVVFPSSKHVRAHCVCNGRRLNCELCTDEPQVIKESHVCNTCEVTFTNVEAMQSHCSCSGQDICIECFSKEDNGTSFVENEDYPNKPSEALDVLHRNGLQECKICGDFFIDRNALLIHEKEHVKLKCSKCRRKFNSAKELRRHEGNCRSKIQSSNHCVTNYANIPRSKYYRCGECGMETNFKESLVRHMKIHSKTYPYECRVCRKGFKHKWSMNRHEFLHSGVKPFICPICQAAFADLGNCKAHQKLHLGIRRSYKCPQCPRTFNSRISCARHKKQCSS